MTDAGERPSTTTPTHARSTLGRVGVGLGALSLALVVLGAIGAKLGVLGSLPAFGLSTAGAALAALAGLIVGLVALVLALRTKPRLGLRGPSVAVALCGLLLALYAGWAANASKQAPIHDIATDWRDPLMPSPQLLADRGEKANPVETAPVAPGAVGSKPFAGLTLAEVNRRTCPGATAVIRAEPVDQAFTRVRDAVKAAGLRIVSDDVRSGRLEAVATSGWYGFKDDLIVRVRPENAGARIDMRSISRMGVSDLGVNCARITKLRQALAG